MRSFLKHEKFWTRIDRKPIKQKEIGLQEIWNEIQEKGDNIDLLITLHKLSSFVGRYEA